MKKNKGITLIALVITIIVLLILAGVSISIFVGDNGVVTNASKSQSKNVYGIAEENMRLVNMVVRTEIEKELANNSSYNAIEDENFMKLVNLVKRDLEFSDLTKTTEGKWTVDETTKPVITIIYTDSSISTLSGAKKNGEIVTKITIGEQEIEKFKFDCDEATLYEQINSSNYGDYVDLGTNLTLTGSTLSDGVEPLEDWRIFYKDTENNKVYLILSDYLPYSYETTLETGLKRYGSYLYNWKSDTSRTDLITGLEATSSWKKLLQGTKLYSNSKVEVLGAIDIEKWVASWNEKGYTHLYIAQKTTIMSDGKYGYYIGTSENPTSIYYGLSNDTEGYSDSLYFPHKSSVPNCNFYWLSSPSAGYYKFLLSVNYWGDVYYGGYDDSNAGVRAIVSLPADVLAKSSKVSGKTVWSISD